MTPAHSACPPVTKRPSDSAALSKRRRSDADPPLPPSESREVKKGVREGVGADRTAPAALWDPEGVCRDVVESCSSTGSLQVSQSQI